MLRDHPLLRRIPIILQTSTWLSSDRYMPVWRAADVSCEPYGERCVHGGQTSESSRDIVYRSTMNHSVFKCRLWMIRWCNVLCVHLRSRPSRQTIRKRSEQSYTSTSTSHITQTSTDHPSSAYLNMATNYTTQNLWYRSFCDINQGRRTAFSWRQMIYVHVATRSLKQSWGEGWMDIN